MIWYQPSVPTLRTEEVMLPWRACTQTPDRPAVSLLCRHPSPLVSRKTQPMI